MEPAVAPPATAPSVRGGRRIHRCANPGRFLRLSGRLLPWLALAAFSGSIVYFVTPSDLAAKPGDLGRMVRLGGLVQQRSVAHVVSDGGPLARFRITDKRDSVSVRFAGILPGLFREGQGVLVTGRLAADGEFRADEVLADYSADYMPAATWDTMTTPGTIAAPGQRGS